MQNDAFKKAYEALQEERERTMTFMQKYDGQKQLSKRKKAITRLLEIDHTKDVPAIKTLLE